MPGIRTAAWAEWTCKFCLTHFWDSDATCFTRRWRSAFCANRTAFRLTFARFRFALFAVSDTKN